jgi:DNA polymerase-1
MELPLIPVLVAMETAGVLVDRRWLAALSAEMGAKINETAEAIYTLAGERFVIGSTQQLQRILFDKLALPSGKRTKTGHTTAAGHLETLAEEHPIARLVLEHREASKLKGTYADALPRLVRPETGRIHTTLHQTVTATGRLASSDPNLQNVPVRSEAGRAIRRAFVAPEGKSLLSCDYSQIELRVFAHFTGDPEMRRAFDADEDIHTATATRLFGVAGDAVTPDMRRRAKTVNFAVIYGQSDFGLSQGLGIGMGEAREFIAQYFALFPGVKVWTASVLEEARARGYVATLLGRRRYLPDLTSTNRNVRQGAERAAVNMPIQGTAADIMKLAMIAVARDVEAGNRPWTPLLQVHDELLIETPTGALAEAATTVRALMEGAFRLDVRLRVDAKAGANWADMAPVAGAS